MRVSAVLADPGTAKRILTRKMEQQTRYKMEDIGFEMVKRANSKMADQFDLSRPGSRRRYPGSTRASNALDYQVDGSTFPIEVRFRVRGGDSVVKRIIFMNYGTRPHTITANGDWEGRGVTNPIPISEGGPRGGQKLAWFEDGYWTIADEVDHPGQQGRHFLEEAREEAVAKVLRQ